MTTLTKTTSLTTLERLVNRYSAKLETVIREIAILKDEIDCPGGVESEEEADFVASKYEKALIGKEAELEILKRIVSDLKLEM